MSAPSSSAPGTASPEANAPPGGLALGKPTVLIVDDDSISVEIASFALRELAEISIVAAGRDALPRVLAEQPDMVLLDVRMPDIDGIAVCEALKADPRTRDIPVIFVTGADGEADEARGLLAGAVEYVTKPIRPALLAARVRNLLELRRNRDGHTIAIEGPTDPLTGLASRRRLEEALAVEWRRAARRGRPLSFLVLELGGLDAVEHLLGAGGVEDSLRRVADVLSAALARPDVLITRFSGDRFAVLLPDTDEEAASRCAEAARSALEGAGIELHLGVGAATAHPAAASLPAELVGRAHQKLDQALRLVQGGVGMRRLPRLPAAVRGPGGAAKVFVVDDDPLSIEVLSALALGAGYEVEFARDATEALALIETARPDVVLMDVEMPGVDGFEACRRLKANPLSAEIPVIFLSALSNASDKVRAFEAGGADYVGKPFEPEEVLARVAHQIKITQLQAEMRAANDRLRELDRLKATFAAMLVHDLRSPLTVVHTTLGFLQSRSFADDPDLGELVGFSGEAVNKSLALIAEVLEIYRSGEAATPAALIVGDVVDVLRRSAIAARVEAKRREVVLETRYDGPLPARIDGQRLERAVNNLLTNALKFTPRGGRVALEARKVLAPGPPRVRIDVRDSGEGIAESELPHVFELYRQANTRHRTAGVGLGLAIVKRIVDAHQGSVLVRSQPGVGSVFTIELPLVESP
jgi:two-component system sensor histidine kinase/response regulator